MLARAAHAWRAHARSMRRFCATGFCLAFAQTAQAAASEDIEFVSEHLAEVAMDNRYATLPVFAAFADEPAQWSFGTQGAWANTQTGQLTLAGPLFAVFARRTLSERWALTAYGFMDALSLSGDGDHRPLQTSFAPATPLRRPVDAVFDNLDGELRHFGAGLSVSWTLGDSWIGAQRWSAGLLWEDVELHGDRLDYEVLQGPSAGVRGQIDFDADYVHVTPVIGFELPRRWQQWGFNPHLLIAVPLPRRGVTGHITGPGFDLRGDTQQAGHGTHFGDPSLTVGFDVEYVPAHLTVDLGAMLTQRFLEPLIHEGIETNWLLSVQWQYGSRSLR
jgi:hypothetical protein